LSALQEHYNPQVVNDVWKFLLPLRAVWEETVSLVICARCGNVVKSDEASKFDGSFLCSKKHADFRLNCYEQEWIGSKANN